MIPVETITEMGDGMIIYMAQLLGARPTIVVAGRAMLKPNTEQYAAMLHVLGYAIAKLAVIIDEEAGGEAPKGKVVELASSSIKDFYDALCEELQKSEPSQPDAGGEIISGVPQPGN